MYDYYFTFLSVTTATRAQKALERARISAALSRAPQPLRTNGCGYTVQVRGRELNRTREIFRREEVRWQRLYRKTGEGFREVSG